MSKPSAKAANPTGKPRKTGYTVGITIFVKDGGDYAFFNNGLRQNVLFLYHLFKAAPACGKVLLLNHGPGEPPASHAALQIDHADIVRTRDVLDDLDYLIVIGGAVDRHEMDALRERGCKLILYKGGNGAVISMEAMVPEPPGPSAETYYDYDSYHEIWMTPQHMHTYGGWCRTLYNCPVYEVPQVWSPVFLKTMAERTQREFGFKLDREKWRIGIMDPNITVLKTSHMPMLVCEAAHRRAPNMLGQVLVSNALRLKENPHFKAFAHKLRITQDAVISVEDRWVSWVFLNDYCDAVVTHHWENGLNYLYYDVLYGNYPLIHNSEFLKDYGYYFPDFEPQAGADMLIHAFAQHQHELEDYKKRNKRLFHALDPTNPDTVAIHERLMLGD